MKKIATPEDLDSELRTLLAKNRSGSTRQELSESLSDLASRVAVFDPAAAIKKAVDHAWKALDDLKALSEIMNRVYPYGQYSRGSLEDHVRASADNMFATCKNVIKDLESI